jgi:hypothetical protein
MLLRMKISFLLFLGVVISATIESCDATSRRSRTIKPSDIGKYQRNNVCSPTQIVGKQRVSSRTITKEQQISRGGQQQQVQVANTLSNALLGSIVLALIEKLFKEGLGAAKIKFPAGLGACVGLFFFLVTIDLISPSTASLFFNALTPAAALLTKWLPVLFVPGLVCLPLSPPIGSASEVSVLHLYLISLFKKKTQISMFFFIAT